LTAQVDSRNETFTGEFVNAGPGDLEKYGYLLSG
jgi:hypothetical protein